MENTNQSTHHWLDHSIRIATENVRQGKGGPFGSAVVRNGTLIAEGVNLVTQVNDPTAHAEIVAIREACRKLGTFDLSGCEIYASCEPCPMCLGAIYWARIGKIWFAATRHDAADAGFDDDFIYRDLSVDLDTRRIPVHHQKSDHALEPFIAWSQKQDRIRY